MMSIALLLTLLAAPLTEVTDDIAPRSWQDNPIFDEFPGLKRSMDHTIDSILDSNEAAPNHTKLTAADRQVLHVFELIALAGGDEDKLRAAAHGWLEDAQSRDYDSCSMFLDDIWYRLGREEFPEWGASLTDNPYQLFALETGFRRRTRELDFGGAMCDELESYWERICAIPDDQVVLLQAGGTTTWVRARVAKCSSTYVRSGGYGETLYYVGDFFFRWPYRVLLCTDVLGGDWEFPGKDLIAANMADVGRTWDLLWRALEYGKRYEEAREAAFHECFDAGLRMMWFSEYLYDECDASPEWLTLGERAAAECLAMEEHLRSPEHTAWHQGRRDGNQCWMLDAETHHYAIGDVDDVRTWLEQVAAKRELRAIVPDRDRREDNN